MGIEVRLMHHSSSSLLNLSHVERFRLGCWEWDWQRRFRHIVAIILCVSLFSFQCILWLVRWGEFGLFLAFLTVILIKSTFAFAKTSQTHLHVLAQFFAFQNAAFLKKYVLKHYQMSVFHFCSQKVHFGS